MVGQLIHTLKQSLFEKAFFVKNESFLPIYENSAFIGEYLISRDTHPFKDKFQEISKKKFFLNCIIAKTIHSITHNSISQLHSKASRPREIKSTKGDETILLKKRVNFKFRFCLP
jgi:hypothetical protein